MQVGAKTNETRGHRTHYRGDLVICSAKKWDDDLARILAQDVFQAALIHEFAEVGESVGQSDLPFGCALCFVEVFDCLPTEDFDLGVLWMDNPPKLTESEKAFGNYAFGRFGWRTRNLHRLKEPVPILGKQGMFNINPETERLIVAQL